ncbi:PREDICTED: phosphatidylinositol 3,4,5-trisphosphate 5-phosphatase 2A-like [Priapulus caudatus]|uniref:phosphatidylinositol-3,4,5-trisphosphate 5-phosphatase n=1 Tax=Priapulus caudatus TaxID=37621 RepID=A0ABM1E551_PRICU|nr:PREDICTED: phosphatidylinositol 3,4,5-trisphosphate 5-phosphatase 2A-like [Priapulus caudatus]
MPPGWLHQRISRTRAGELLLENSLDGAFLVRSSETVDNAFVLCVLFEGTIHHYRIFTDPNGSLSIQVQEGAMVVKYDTLDELIQGHSRLNNGLITMLRYPVLVRAATTDAPTSTVTHTNPVITGGASVPVSSAVIKAPTNSEPNAGDDSSDEEVIDVKRFASPLQTKLKQMSPGRFNEELHNKLETYVSNGVMADVEAVNSGQPHLPLLRNVLFDSASSFASEAEIFLKTLDSLRQLFDTSVTSSHKQQLQSSLQRCSSMEDLMAKLKDCITGVGDLEKEVVNWMVSQDALSVTSSEASVSQMSRSVCDEYSYESSGNCQDPPVSPRVPVTAFEVKAVNPKLHVFQTNQKATLTVDAMAGKLYAVKRDSTKDVLDDKNVFTDDRILQLIKCTSNKAKLDICIRGRKKDTYVFTSAQEREKFCQLVQLMHSMHATIDTVDSISVFIGTFNMADSQPMESLANWLLSHGSGKQRDGAFDYVPHDIYVIGTQEGIMGEKDWIHKLLLTLKDLLMIDFIVIACCSLWNIRLVILAKPEHKHRISHIQQATVKTGIANALGMFPFGNKGAVGISFYYNATSFCFINAHLTSGHERLHRRNQNFKDILRGLQGLGDKSLNMFDLTNQFHHVFFFGDLNYRVDFQQTTVVQEAEALRLAPEPKDCRKLFRHDQLTAARQAEDAFCHFSEEEVKFPPTYRFEKGDRSSYSWQKAKKSGIRINLPSWTDRVLLKSFPGTHIVCTSYGCATDVICSDHWPVFSSYEVGIATQFLPTQSDSARSRNVVEIVFENISAEIRTVTHQSFMAEFHSTCLEKPMLSKPNTNFVSEVTGFSSPTWSASVLPKLVPIYGDPGYLEDQHIMIAIKGSITDEYHGECVVALKDMFSITAQPFACFLMHQGDSTGKIRGRMHVKTVQHDEAFYSKRSATRTYELVSFDELEDSCRYTDGPGKSSGHLPKKHQSMLEPTASNFPDLACRPNTAFLEHTNVYEPVQAKSATVFYDLPPDCKPTVEDSKAFSNNIAQPILPPEESPGPPIPQRSTHVDTSMALFQFGELESLLAAEEKSLSQAEAAPKVAERRNSLYDNHPDPEFSCVALDEGTPAESRGLSTLTPQDQQVLSAREWSPGVSQSSQPVPKPRTRSRASNVGAPGEVDAVASSPTAAASGNTLRYAQAAIYDTPKPRPQAPAKPQVPKRFHDSAATRKMTTIGDWLSVINLQQYTNRFLFKGWDSLEFITDLTKEDLEEMNVSNVEHQDTILNSIKELFSH